MQIDDIYQERSEYSHKGQFGKVLIVSGSKRYTGSPIFNALSALRTGADLVTVISERRASDIASSFLPDIISIPLDNELSVKDVPLILKESESFDSLVIGGGLDRSLETFKAVRELITKVKIPLVIDAEAIRAVAEDVNVLKDKLAIITPHGGEFEVLAGKTPTEDLAERKKEIKDLAKRINSTVLLKSGTDIISDGIDTVLNDTGSFYMTKGGFGDTLAGICGALLARNTDSTLKTTYLAAYINGMAGERASEVFGESVLASDIFSFMPEVIQEIITDPPVMGIEAE